jgi:hypothetical protein
MRPTGHGTERAKDQDVERNRPAKLPKVRLEETPFPRPMQLLSLNLR